MRDNFFRHDRPRHKFINRKTKIGDKSWDTRYTMALQIKGTVTLAKIEGLIPDMIAKMEAEAEAARRFNSIRWMTLSRRSGSSLMTRSSSARSISR